MNILDAEDLIDDLIKNSRALEQAQGLAVYGGETKEDLERRQRFLREEILRGLTR